MTSKIQKSDSQWREILTPEEYRVLREKGTEAPFSGKLTNNKDEGEYLCAACGKKLFSSAQKFDSGCGWPSFSQAADRSHIEERSDVSHGMERTEVLCKTCGSHLGHLFDDGPKPTGQRYCINSVSLSFAPKDESLPTESPFQYATFAAGCFWCTDAAFRLLEGVIDVEVGYMGGETEDPTYEEVCTGKTGHAEVARVLYDSRVISYKKLLDLFWKIHDPTSLNQQGGDVGTQYRSAIFFHSEKQHEEAEQAIAKLQAEWGSSIVTELSPAEHFFRAEAYHQNYYAQNPTAGYCAAVIQPKLKKIQGGNV